MSVFVEKQQMSHIPAISYVNMLRHNFDFSGHTTTSTTDLKYYVSLMASEIPYDQDSSKNSKLILHPPAQMGKC